MSFLIDQRSKIAPTPQIQHCPESFSISGLDMTIQTKQN